MAFESWQVTLVAPRNAGLWVKCEAPVGTPAKSELACLFLLTSHHKNLRKEWRFRKQFEDFQRVFCVFLAWICLGRLAKHKTYCPVPRMPYFNIIIFKKK